MRDIFEEIFESQPIDPAEAARRSLRRPLRARFYQGAGVGEGEDVCQVLLDGKPVRTPARRALAAPVRAVAEAIATEWALQGQTIDPETMPLTRLANSIIDGVAVTPMPVATEIEKYLGTDLLFYRAGEPEGLVARQREHWDPVVEWAREIFGARFVLAEGVIHVAQPPAAITAAAAAIPREIDDAASAWRLGALSAVTTICGSALLALALAAGRLAPEQVWAAAHVDEDWNIEKWGRDESVMERRAQRNTEFLAAAKVLALLR